MKMHVGTMRQQIENLLQNDVCSYSKGTKFDVVTQASSIAVRVFGGKGTPLSSITCHTDGTIRSTRGDTALNYYLGELYRQTIQGWASNITRRGYLKPLLHESLIDVCDHYVITSEEVHVFFTNLSGDERHRAFGRISPSLRLQEALEFVLFQRGILMNPKLATLLKDP